MRGGFLFALHYASAIIEEHAQGDAVIRARSDMAERLPQLARKTCERATHYLLGRQSPTGGFCFYRSGHVDEPNLGDTYHAVATLALLGCQIPDREHLLKFLSYFAESGQPSDLFHYIRIMRTLDPTASIDGKIRRHVRQLRITPPAVADSPQITGWLEQTRLIVSVKSLLNELREAADVRRFVNGMRRNGGYGENSNIWDTWLALEILESCEYLRELRDVAEFIDRIQILPSGFTVAEGTMSTNLEVLFAGIQCCALLGISIKYPEHALAFVLACQAANGGFARAPGALPNIELTHRGVAAVLTLSGWRPENRWLTPARLP